MLNTWKDVLMLFQSKVSTIIRKTSSLFWFKNPHKCEIVTQVNEHVDLGLLLALKLFECHFILKHDSKASVVPYCNISLRAANSNSTGGKN